MNRRTFSFVLALAFALSQQCVGQDPLETLVDAGPLGLINGSRGFTFANYKPMVTFLGIPYAKAPVDEGRFMPPEPINGPLVPENPDDIFNATREGIVCTQPFLGGTEDCLILNVYTPKLPVDGGTGYPVIVFIHGGAFLSGSSTAYKPDRFIETEEVVSVTINYRLGILGFFCLEKEETPGNAALYDALVALQWIRNYISHFGGDPDNITVSGQSAGAVLLNYLMVSPMAQEVPEAPLFHRAILMSGSSLNPWAINETPKQVSLKIARLADCSDTDEPADEDIPDIIECMQAVDAQKLISVLTTYQNDERFEGRLGTDIVSPVLQTWDLESSSPLITRHPRLILEEGKQMNVSLMAGSTMHDGSFPLGIVYNRYLNCELCSDRVHDSFFLRKQLVPTLLRAMGIQDGTGIVYDGLAELYLKDAKNSGNYSEMVYGLVDLHSVFFFKAGIYQNALLHSKLNPSTYFYSFEYSGEHTFFDFYFTGFPIPEVPGGIAHGDDLFFLLWDIGLNENDTQVSEQLVSQWVNFAKTGNPTPFGFGVTWPPLKELDPRYLQMTFPLPLVQEEYPNTFTSAADVLRPPPVEEPTTTTTTTTEAPTPTTTTVAPTTTTTIAPDPGEDGTTEGEPTTTDSGGSVLQIRTATNVCVIFYVLFKLFFH